MLNPVDSPNVADSPSKANAATLMGHYGDYSSGGAWCAPIQRENEDTHSFLTVDDNVRPIELIPATVDPCKLLPPPEELIEGLLKEQGILILGGNSKSGKSFLMGELAIAIATGTTWLGYSCKKGRVLYVNMEIEDSEFQHRLKDIALARGVSDEALDAGVKIMKRPGFLWDMRSLAASIIAKFRGEELDLVIIDPIYMLLDGDENSSATMMRFIIQIERITRALGCAVGLVHHHSKGSLKYSNIFDRVCGSGVLGRYVYTAIDINPLEGTNNAMRAEMGTRSFTWPLPVDYVFDYPIYRLDNTGSLGTRRIASNRNRTGKRETDAARKVKVVEDAFDSLVDERGEVAQSTLSKHLGLDGRTVRKWIEGSGRLKIEKHGRENWVTRQE